MLPLFFPRLIEGRIAGKARAKPGPREVAGILLKVCLKEAIHGSTCRVRKGLNGMLAVQIRSATIMVVSSCPCTKKHESFIKY